MPTYQYRCSECGQDLEVVQRFTDASLTECPNCAGSLRKVYNAVGVVFKGSGFYSTDSRSGNGSASSNGVSGDGESTKSEPTKSGSKSESKSESTKSGSKSGSDSGSNTGSSTGSAAPAKAAAG